MTGAISKEMLELLACPSCKGDLKLGKNRLTCVKCRQSYPIKNGIPHLLPPELTHTKKH
ncbi:MAG: Trm112 family protein [Candidatus Hadarchaeota archaeon]